MEQQKQLQMKIAQDLLDCASHHDQDFMKAIITGDETRVYVYISETKFQSLPMEAPLISKDPKSTKGLKQCECNVDLFLLHS